MNRPSAYAPDGLARTSSGLSASHIALIKLLAAIAVENYLAEIDATDEDDREEAAR